MMTFKVLHGKQCGSTLFSKKAISQLCKLRINIYAAERSVTNLCRMRSPLHMGMVYTLIQHFSGVLLSPYYSYFVMFWLLCIMGCNRAVFQEKPLKHQCHHHNNNNRQIWSQLHFLVCFDALRPSQQFFSHIRTAYVFLG